jgi:hypothetical protein
LNWAVHSCQKLENPKSSSSGRFARANFGKLLGRVEQDCHSLIIAKRGTSRAILLGLQDDIRLAAPEPEVLRLIGEQSAANSTHLLTPRQIEKIIKTARIKNRADDFAASCLRHEYSCLGGA